jgi:hypothetical protein
MVDAMFDTPSNPVSNMKISLEYAREKIDGASAIRLQAS